MPQGVEEEAEERTSLRVVEEEGVGAGVEGEELLLEVLTMAHLVLVEKTKSKKYNLS